MDRIMLEHRGSHGAVNVDMYKTARYITELSARHQTSIIGFIADQSPKKREVRHFLQFLHHKTPVLTGTEKITKHYGFDPWFVRIRKVGRGYYEAEFIHMHDNPKSVHDFGLTQIYYENARTSHPRNPRTLLVDPQPIQTRRAVRTHKRQHPITPPETMEIDFVITWVNMG